MSRRTEKTILDKICEEIGANSATLVGTPLTGFMAMIGERYKGELFVVGRSVNDWTTYINAKNLSTREKRNAVIRGIEKSVTKGDYRPMMWVTGQWGSTTGYNSRKSAFWRVIRCAVGELGIADVESPEWPSHLIWSNLYKFSPAKPKRGNPSTTLCDIQFAGCKALFLEELRIYNYY